MTGEWPDLEPEAFHRLAGEVVRALDPHTEADPSAVLLTFLASVGSAVGPGPHARVGADQHAARISVAIVGETSRARKGSGWSMVRAVMQAADPEWCKRIVGGFGSGERLVDEVADATGDDGDRDRRLLIREPELAKVLTVASRDSSIYSMIIREAWDGSPLSVRTRARVTTATNHHISLVGDITAAELRCALSTTDAANGFANRILFSHARRSKRLPSGGNLDDEEVQRLGAKVRRTLELGRQRGRIRRTPTAEILWAQVYDQVDDSVDGLFGAVTARAEAQMLRLSLIYALLDGRKEIDVEHVWAAVAVWSYCEASARVIFDTNATGNTIADRILEALRSTPDGLDATEVSDLFSRHVAASRLNHAREQLEALGLVTIVPQPTHGAPRRRWFLAKEAKEANKANEGTFADRCRPFLLPPSSLNSLSSHVRNGQGRAKEPLGAFQHDRARTEHREERELLGPHVLPRAAVEDPAAGRRDLEPAESGFERELRMSREAEGRD